jgi:hypothetical protein
MDNQIRKELERELSVPLWPTAARAQLGLQVCGEGGDPWGLPDRRLDPGRYGSAPARPRPRRARGSLTHGPKRIGDRRCGGSRSPET